MNAREVIVYLVAFPVVVFVHLTNKINEVLEWNL